MFEMVVVLLCFLNSNLGLFVGVKNWKLHTLASQLRLDLFCPKQRSCFSLASVSVSVLELFRQ